MSPAYWAIQSWKKGLDYEKDNDTIKVSSESKLQLPLANLIGIILVVSGAVFGYANLTGRIGALETADT